VAAVAANPGARLGATGYLNNPSVFNRESNGVNISQLITDFGRTLDLTSASRLTALSEAEKMRLTRQQVVLIVDVAYFSALKAESLLRVATETVNERSTVSEQAAAMAKRKLRSELDVSFAQANVAEAKLLVLQAQDAVDSSMADLSAALGYQRVLRASLVDEPAESFPKGNVEQLAVQALENRPEAAALRDQQAASVKMVDAERAARFPRVTALAAIGDTPEGDSAVTGRFTAGGVNVEFPAFTGGLLSARQSEAQFRSTAAQKDLEDEEDIIFRDVHVAWLSASTALKRIPVAREFFQSASEALELAGSRYKLGLTSIVEMTQAQLAQTQAEIEFGSAKYDYQIALQKLEFQIGALQYRTSPFNAR